MYTHMKQISANIFYIFIVFFAVIQKNVRVSEKEIEFITIIDYGFS